MGISYITLKIRNPIKGTDYEEIDAKVDTGATMLVLPKRIVDKHKFPFIRKQTVVYADGRTAEKDIVWGVELELFGRKGSFEAVVEDEKDYALLGAIPMEALDLIIEPRSMQVYPNPRSKLPMAEIE